MQITSSGLLDLAGLESLQGAQTILLGPGSFNNIDLPVLSGVGGALNIEFNTQLRSISLPSLNSVGADLVFRRNPVLESVDLSSLSSVARAVFLCDVPQDAVDRVAQQIGKPVTTVCP